MTLKRVGATLAAALALVSSSALVNAAPAAALGGCPVNQLCLYAGVNFNYMDFRTGTVSGCWYWPNYSTAHNRQIVSYVNDLPVNASLWKPNPVNRVYYDAVATIRPGGFSTSTGSSSAFSMVDYVCTGSASPNH
ncbi:peptidase inhibitor [Streptomyces lavendofoliae]|uniref:Peptidase inhibitor family I36 n=1 Tax=Streptomyces lavendofoliae TaxID=67314 RepID=A0A918I3C4_9ACTN|nr:peptidase inhibitor [Streptomyces lavendofoliae]GGU63459.1 hypothetical protein GCM10010274_60300 [Streptomyces lavendofoliae]